MSNIVEVRNLTKSYGSVMAVNQVSFSIETGKIYGLLGRNSAGKTTIMQIITAQLFATSGEVKVVLQKHAESVRGKRLPVLVGLRPPLQRGGRRRSPAR